MSVSRSRIIETMISIPVWHFYIIPMRQFFPLRGTTSFGSVSTPTGAWRRWRGLPWMGYSIGGHFFWGTYLFPFWACFLISVSLLLRCSASVFFAFLLFGFSSFPCFFASLLLCFSASLLLCFSTVLLLCCLQFFCFSNLNTPKMHNIHPKPTLNKPKLTPKKMKATLSTPCLKIWNLHSWPLRLAIFDYKGFVMFENIQEVSFKPLKAPRCRQVFRTYSFWSFVARINSPHSGRMCLWADGRKFNRTCSFQ